MTRFQIFALATSVSGLAVLGLASCSGQKFSNPAQDQAFAVGENFNPNVDILWVVDNSGSMADKQAHIAAEIQPMLSAVESLGIDFHIGFVTTDMRDESDASQGRLLPFDGSGPTVLTPGTPDLIDQFTSHIEAGTSGSIVPEGLAAMRAAFSPQLLSTDNSGFLRSGSFLVVIVLSDQDDNSPTADDESMLNTLRPPLPSGEYGWQLDFIGTLENDPYCTTSSRGLNVPGTKYIALANDSAGSVESICSGDFATALSDIQSKLVSMVTEYHLAEEPDLTTLTVTVDGNLIPEDANNGWTYISQGYTIKFHGSAVPSETSVIDVHYEPLHAKD